jgi:hypothetical protein
MPACKIRIVLAGGLRYQLLSETRIAVCPIPRPVFVLWFTPSSGKGAVSRDSCPGQSESAVGSVSAGVVTSTRLEGGESPEAFHA